MSKLRAFTIHFLASFFVLALFFTLVFLVWYPPPYFDTEGSSHVAMILVGVDLVLGPLLTLILFKPGKKGLMFDMMFILTVQIVAFVYGSHTLITERPQFVVFSIDRYNVVPASNIDQSRLKRPELKTHWFSGPKLIAARLPSDPMERSDLVLEVTQGLPDVERRPEYYEPYAESVADVLSRLRPVDQLLQDRGRPQNRQLLRKALKKAGETAETVGFLPLVGKSRDMVFLIKRSDASIVGVIDTYLWIRPKPAKEAKS